MQNKANLLDNQMNVSSVKTKYYKNERFCRRRENKPKQSRSEFIPKGAEIPTGVLLGILKPGTKQRQLPLFSAIPQVECRNEPSVRDHRTAFIGEVPSALNPPAGCAFGPRCPLADNNCTKHIPNLEEKGDSEGHFVACWNRKIRKNEVRT